MSIIFTVFVLRMHHASEYTAPVPPKLYDFMTKKLARLVGLRKKVLAYQLGRSKPHPNANFNKMVISPSPIANLMGPANLNKYADNSNIPTCSRLNCYRVSELNSYKSKDKLSSSFDQVNDEINIKTKTESDKTDIQNDWKLCALIFDRLLFWIFGLITSSSSLSILFIIPLFNYMNHKSN